MNRRRFIKLAITLLPTIALHGKIEALTTLKGFCANDESPSLVNILQPDTVRITWGSWLNQNNNQYGAMKWVIDLSDIDQSFPFTPSNVSLISSHGSYSGYYLLGNEPDIGQTPQQYIDSILPQIDIVLQGDSLASFAFAGGTHTNPWYLNGSWFQQAWDLMPRGTYRQAVKAFHVHCYPPFSLSDYVSLSNTYRNIQFPSRQIFLSEVGKPVGNSNIEYTPTSVNSICVLNNISRWFWFAQKPIQGTASASVKCLLKSNNTLSSIGDDFINI